MDEHISAEMPESDGQSILSYKFQRLREKLRAAIASGELSGKLPGERTLAKRFHANAKTLSKALTDLAAEGILDRSIGRGTYVKGSEPAAPTQGRWLVIGDAGEAGSSLVDALRSANPESQIITSVTDLRPSFLNQFAAVIDAASNTPESFLRDLVVRNMPVVGVSREPQNYSIHSVLLDVALGVSRLGRDLVLAGHRRFAAVEPPGSTTVSTVLRQSIARYDAEASVDVCSPDDISTMLDSGVTAIICGSCSDATHVKSLLQKLSALVPAQVSLAAVGCTADLAPCSGYYCTADQIAQAVAGVLRDAVGIRPATLWLAGTFHDLGTTGPTAIAIEEAAGARLDGALV